MVAPTGLNIPYPLPGGRVEPERRLEGQQFTKLGRKYQHDSLYLQSINSDKHLPQSPFTDNLTNHLAHFPTNKTSLFFINVSHPQKDIFSIHLWISSYIPKWSISNIFEIHIPFAFRNKYQCMYKICIILLDLRSWLTDHVSSLSPHFFHVSCFKPQAWILVTSSSLLLPHSSCSRPHASCSLFIPCHM